jgi:hypothetical protein
MIKTKYILILFFIAFMSSCSAPAYVPNASRIGKNPYGGFIRISLASNDHIEGELIAVDSGGIYIMETYKASGRFIRSQNANMDSLTRGIRYSSRYLHIVSKVPRSSVASFSLHFSRNRFKWAIPIITLLAAYPGWAMTISYLYNYILLFGVIEHSGKYKSKDITYDDLKMFARYPQGIPEGVVIDSIR